jgi:hypothetical protein
MGLTGFGLGGGFFGGCTGSLKSVESARPPPLTNGLSTFDGFESLPWLSVMTKEPEYNNAKLAYEHTKQAWIIANASYDVITTKLTTLLAFSGVLIKFAADLSETSWLVYVKIGICVILIMAIASCCAGLIPRGTGKGDIDPDDFLDDENRTDENPTRYYLSEEVAYLYIARGLNNSLKGLQKNRKYRIRCLETSIWLLSVGSTGFAISIMGKAIMGIR